MRVSLRCVLPLFLSCAAAVPALAINPQRRVPIPELVAVSEVIAVGKVVALEDRFTRTDVNGWTTEIQTARVHVLEDLKGAGGATELRVIFVPRENQGNIPTPVLAVGQELCLFLGRDGDVYHLWGPGVGRPATVPGGSEDVAETAAEARKLLRLLREHGAGLTFEDPDERMLLAWMLAVRYRRFPNPPARPVEKPIDAAESRLILEGLVQLADKDQVAFWDVFESLDLQLQDGWDPDFQSWHGIHEKAQAWVRDHAATWRFRRRVPAPAPVRTPPVSPPPVALSTDRATTTWLLRFDLADRDAVEEIRFRLAPDGEWISTFPNQSAAVPPDWIRPGRHLIEVDLVDRAGNVSGPYTLWLDPEEEVLRWAKHDLRQRAYSWVELDRREYLSEGSLFFSDLLDVRDVLREIRYSLDDCSLDQRFPFTPWTDLLHAPGDGETTEPHRFWFRRPETAPEAAEEASIPETPAAPAPVTLLSYRSNSGWTLIFDVDETKVREVRYRFGRGGEWISAGDYPALSPHTGLPRPNTSVPMDPLRVAPGRHRIEVQLVDPAGKVSGPYTLWFDPAAEVLAEAKTSLGGFDWVSFGDRAEWTDTIIYFQMLGSKDALREVRYSLDDCDLDQRLPFEPWTDLGYPPESAEDGYIRVPKTTTYACIQLVYSDGETTEPRRFEHRRSTG